MPDDPEDPDELPEPDDFLTVPADPPAAELFPLLPLFPLFPLVLPLLSEALSDDPAAVNSALMMSLFPLPSPEIVGVPSVSVPPANCILYDPEKQ